MRRRWLVLAVRLAALVAVTMAADSARPTVNSIGMTLIEIPAGSSEMGADSTPIPDALTKGPNGVIYDRPGNQGDYDEAPVHTDFRSIGVADWSSTGTAFIRTKRRPTPSAPRTASPV